MARDIAAQGGTLTDAARAAGLNDGQKFRQSIEARNGAGEVLAQLVENGKAARGRSKQRSGGVPLVTRATRLRIARDAAGKGESLIAAAKACGLTSGHALKASISGFEAAPAILAQLAQNGRQVRAGKCSAVVRDAKARGCVPYKGQVTTRPARGVCDAPDRAAVAVVAPPARLVRVASGASVRAVLPAGFGASFNDKGGRGDE